MKHFLNTQPDNSKARNLLLDCDGVLLNWLGGFIQYAQHALGKPLDPAGPNDFNLSAGLVSMTPPATP